MVMNTKIFKFITEIMSDIEADNDNVQKYLSNTTLRAVFEYCYDPAKKFALPEGNPPYRPAPEPVGMTPTNFLQTVRIWPNFRRVDLKPVKREALWINLLEGVHESEALLLCAIKNGTLTRLYPFATLEFGIKYGFLDNSILSVKTESEEGLSVKPKRTRSPNGIRTPRKGSVAARVAENPKA